MFGPSLRSLSNSWFSKVLSQRRYDFKITPKSWICPPPPTVVKDVMYFILCTAKYSPRPGKCLHVLPLNRHLKHSRCSLIHIGIFSSVFMRPSDRRHTIPHQPKAIKGIPLMVLYPIPIASHPLTSHNLHRTSSTITLPLVASENIYVEQKR